MTPRALFLRNVISIVGAYYTFALLWTVVWIVVLQISGSVPVEPILHFGTALLTGLACGYFLESKSAIAWSVGAGIFVATCVWSTMHWYVKPPQMEVFWHGAESAGAGVVAGMSCWIAWRRRLTRSSVADA